MQKQKKTNRLEADIRNFNMFSSKELAENIMRFEILNRKILKRISEICEPVDWNNCYESKYVIYYDRASETLNYNYRIYCQYELWVCDTEEHAKQIINEFKDDLIWFFTEYKTRMDG